MANRQVLTCLVCGKSNDFPRYNIGTDGTASPERQVYPVKISLCHQDKKDGRMFWTHHGVPMQVLVAYRQKLVEALAQIDTAIAEGAADEG